MAEERNEEIEKQCREQLVSEKEFLEKNDVAQIRNKLMMFDEVKATVEKLKGRFDLRINSQLKMPSKINKLAIDPLAFHLHKNRQFMRKLQTEKKQEPSTGDLVSRIQAQMKADERRGRRHRLWLEKGVRIPEAADSEDYDSEGRTEHMRLLASRYR